jgi:hypothetical protein
MAAPEFDGNSKSIGTSFADILTMPLFLKGYDQVWAGEAFNSADINSIKGCQWAYERGRQFATLQKLHGPQQKLKIKQPVHATRVQLTLWPVPRGVGLTFEVFEACALQAIPLPVLAANGLA